MARSAAGIKTLRRPTNHPNKPSGEKIRRIVALAVVLESVLKSSGISRLLLQTDDGAGLECTKQVTKLQN